MKENRSNGVIYYSFENMENWPELTQAAFARPGGVSEGPLGRLNLSFAVGDDPERVRTNRQIAVEAVGWQPRDIVSARQVHGRRVAQVVREMTGGPDLLETDAVVTDEPGVLLLLKFADCVPIVLWDPEKRVVGLAHAGWRGTVLGTPAAAVEMMVKRYGASASRIIAGIGPSIGPCCYQVGPEVVTAASRVFGGTGVMQRFGESDTRLDLWAANAETLMRAGLAEENIAVAGICTRCHSDLFFSHRGSGGMAGRFGVVAGIHE